MKQIPCKPLLLAAAAALALAACSKDNDTLSGDGSGDGTTPVTFTTAIQSVALPAAQSSATHTRTATDAEGQAVWTDGDAVSLFMLSAGGALYDDVFPGALNKKYNADPATGALSPDDGKLLYYPPQKQAADFIAVYPYYDKWEQLANIGSTFCTIVIGVQTPAAYQSECDILYSNNARNVTPGKDPVALRFRHLLSKLRFNIALGDGLDGGNITEVRVDGMPIHITIDIRDGSMDYSPGGNGISALKLDAPATGADATFTAIAAPIEAGEYTIRRIYITIDGVDYTGTIPDDAYAPGKQYTYPVTVQKSGVTLGTAGISDWTTAPDHGTGTAEYFYRLTFDANGASGTPPAPQEAGSITGIVLPDGTGLTPPAGKTEFLGWSTTPDYSGDFYRPGYNTLTLTRNTTLYAVWDGDGSATNPRLIFDEGGMSYLWIFHDRHFRLMKDVTVNNWEPVGLTEGLTFIGTFDGQGHTVTIGSIDGRNWPCAGLFGKAEGCQIRRLCVAGTIDYTNNTDLQAYGGIVGEAGDGCLIENCLVTATLDVRGSSDLNLGGIVGRGPAGGSATVRNCLVLGPVRSKNDEGKVGGIVGDGRNTSVTNCVVLSSEVSSKFDISLPNPPYRIGQADALSNNYARSDISPGQGAFVWIPALNGEDGLDCDAQPGAAWWTAAGRWNTSGDNTAWDFTNIWEIALDGYPHLRIVQP